MASYLDIRTCVSTVERAMLDTVSLAYQNRLDEVADIAALQGLISDTKADLALRFVVSEGTCYRWRGYSNAAQVLPFIVRPNDRSETQNGRWERTSSAVTLGPAYFRPVNRVRRGYAKAVELYQGQGDTGAALDRIYGLTPAFLIRYEGMAVGERITAGPYGALYSTDMDFSIWCLSKNFRPQNQALLGSDFVADLGPKEDPGVNRMVGDIQYLFGTGTNLGLGPGVAQCRINGSTEIIDEAYDQRQFLAVVPIKVQASLNIPDEDLISPFEVFMQFEQAGGILTPSEDFDLSNYVALGLMIETGAGLNGTPVPGAAYIGGQLVTAQPGAHLFTANRETYRFLTAGGFFYYLEQFPGQPVPATPPGTLLVGVTATDSDSLVNDAFLCNYAQPSGPPFRAA